jgi:uncharacterized membrane protein
VFRTVAAARVYVIANYCAIGIGFFIVSGHDAVAAVFGVFAVLVTAMVVVFIFAVVARLFRATRDGGKNPTRTS